MVVTVRKLMVGALLGFIVLFSPMSKAIDIQCGDNGAETVKWIFLQLASMPRRSYAEYAPAKPDDPVNTYFREFVDAANEQCWDGEAKLVLQFDAYGNAMIVIPATGEFAGKSQPDIILQAHSDIVWETADKATGGALERAYANGVDVVTTGNLVHSRDYQTTLGADNGLGLAAGLRYALAPGLAHPGLRLIVTRDEETSFNGIFNLGFPFENAGAYVSMDFEGAEKISVGAMGARETTVSGELEGRYFSRNYKRLKITLSGLAGGHSGLDAHRNRAHAGMALLHWLNEFLPQFELPDDVYVTRIKAGTGVSIIPSGFEVELAFPERLYSQSIYRRVVESAFQFFGPAWIDQFEGEEDYSKLRIEAGMVEDNSPRVGLNRDVFQKLVHVLLNNMSHGQVATEDTRFTNGLRTTTNMGIFSLSPSSTARHLDLRLGLFDRSYIDAEMVALGNRNGRVITEAFPTLQASNPEKMARAWLPDYEGWLFRLVREQFPNRDIITMAGASEVNVVSEWYPQLPKVGLGFDIHDMHSARERYDESTVGLVLATADRLLLEIGRSPDFQPVDLTQNSRPAPKVVAGGDDCAGAVAAEGDPS